MTHHAVSTLPDVPIAGDDGSSSVGGVFAALRGHVVQGVTVTDLFVVATGSGDMDILVSVARDMVSRGEVPMVRLHRDPFTNEIAGVVLVRAEAAAESTVEAA